MKVAFAYGFIAGALALYGLFEATMLVASYRADCAGLTKAGVRQELKVCAHRFTCAWSKF